ncbi:MAG TPA: DUF87 domain-containing protein [Bryobacteraceae bacterium]|nr:DUF87 domain-containing protein [Bryobacteraceae bacterium]
MTAALPTHTEIQPCTFLDDGVFATKSGQVGIVLRLSPMDSECMEAPDIAGVAYRFQAAVRQFGPGYLVYQYLVKRRSAAVACTDRARAEYLASKGLYSFETYLVVIRDGIAVAPLRRDVEAFTSQMAGSLPAILSGRSEAYRFFRGLLNYDETLAAAVPLKYNEHIDYYASDSPIEGHRGFLRVGDHFTKVLTLKETPTLTGADLLRPLREIDGECIIVTEWKPIDSQAARSLIHTKTSHFHRAKYASNLLASVITRFSADRQAERPEDMQKDESASAMERQLGELAADIEQNGTLLGEFALTVIMFGLDQKVVSDGVSLAFRAMAERGAVLYEERHNVLSAWLAALPGGRRHQRRAMYVTNRNYADMGILFAPDAGQPVNEHLGAGALAVMETRQRTTYYANLHYQDVGHALISGMTGSGKSFLSDYLIRNALDKYDARIVIFDIGGSYRRLASQMRGAYVDVGLENAFTINPFSLPDSRETRQFLFSFVKVLIESGEKRMTVPEQEQLYRAISGNARLGDLVDRLPESLRPFLARWTGDGQYAYMFDNGSDTLTYSRLQVFDFSGLEKYPQVVEPLLFYVLHRANADLAASGFKVFLLDEAWRFLLNPTVKAYIFEGLKTWRKRNAAMWLATQSIGDLQNEMLQTVAENCGYLVLLPNPRMDRDEYRKVFKLNEAELDMVATMQPKRESLWKPAVGASKVVVLDAGRTQ